MKIRTLLLGSSLLLTSFMISSVAQDHLPESPVKKTFTSVCSGCHDLGTATAERRTKAGWKTVVDQMAERGARASDPEFDAIIDYLAKYLGVVNVNQASAKELEETLEISADAAGSIVRYRTGSGSFADLDALKKVPGLVAATIDERKDRITFK